MATFAPLYYIDAYTTPAVTGGYHVALGGKYTAAQIGAIGNAVNTTGKTAGKKIWDSTNKRVMIASGTSAGSAWTAYNGSSSITPV